MSKTFEQEPNYWRSFEELHDSASFHAATKDEFSSEAAEAPSLSEMAPVDRRKFLGLMAAGAALAGTGCYNYRDEGEVLPYNNMDERTIPGVATYYASTLQYNGASHGVLVKSRTGRPIKIDGNPQHPVNQGKVPAAIQAATAALYDPERLTGPTCGGQPVEWDVATADLQSKLEAATDEEKKILVISNSILSPSKAKLLKQFQEKYTTTQVLSYELHDETYIAKAWETLYGVQQVPGVAWGKARVILALENDLLATESHIHEQRAFGKNREVKKGDKINRLYSVEGDMSVTGGASDIRLRLNPAKQFAFAKALLTTLVKKHNLGQGVLSPEVTALLNGPDLAAFAAQEGLDAKVAEVLVKDLVHAKSKSVVAAGPKLDRKVQILALAINQVLGSIKLFKTGSISNAVVPASSKGQIRKAVESMAQGQVAVVLHLESNPVFHLPQELGYAKALENVATVASFSSVKSETVAASNCVFAINHGLESWNDFSDKAGVYALQQPMIAPIHNTRQLEDILLVLNGRKYDAAGYRKFIKQTATTEIRTLVGSSLPKTLFWQTAIHDGYVATPTQTPEYTLNNAALVETLKKDRKAPEGITVIFKAANSIGNGDLANIGWLQELSHPISKITWDNYAAMAPATIKKMGFKLYPKSGDDEYEVINLKVGDRRIQLPVYAQAGMAEDVVSVELGYGQEEVGVIAEGVGFNAQKLMAWGGSYGTWIIDGVKATPSNTFHKLASTQEHYAIDAVDIPEPTPIAELIEDAHLRRGVIKEGTLDDYKSNPKFVQDMKHAPTFTMDRPHQYPGVKWSMVVDQNKCTGCSDCVIACNVENNIPVVGKAQVLRGREMHWMRIDRYYSGTPEQPQMSTQPMLCQQCDNAPCENVCPVVATTHSPEGINEMTYNRCVGTRYCANNCPYKVRRFNFYNFRLQLADGYQEKPAFSLLHNPEVTVRSRGVMEKCNFCLQRLNTARAEAKRNKQEWTGKGVTVACQDACSTNAIYFGNINDPKSAVAKFSAHELGYKVLEETAIRPNVTYVAKVRNNHKKSEGKAH